MLEEIVKSDFVEGESQAPLTQGLFRNTLFIVIGWLWTAVLSFITLPFMLQGLGTEAYGVFALVYIILGYLNLSNSPLVFGNIRFMAEAYGRRDWLDFSKYIYSGLWFSLLLTIIGTIAIFFASNFLAQTVFKIPNELRTQAVFAFQWAAVSFFINSMSNALLGIPAAMRRYDVQIIFSSIVGTLGTFGILAVIWLGGDLLSVIMVQVFSNLIGLILSGILAYKLLKSIKFSHLNISPDLKAIKKMFGFSSYMFVNQMINMISLQLDRTLIGVFFGTSATTFYAVPAKITDQLGIFSQKLTTVLYPLSAEGRGDNHLEQLRKIYTDMSRLTMWIMGLPGTFLIVCAQDILRLWVGVELAEKSWIILVILSFISIIRTPSRLATQINNGLGNVHFNTKALVLLMLSITVPLLVLLPIYGVNVGAFGMAVGASIASVSYDICTQRKYLGIKNWEVNIRAYLRVFCVSGTSFLVISLLHFEFSLLLLLSIKFCLFVIIYCLLGVLLGLVQKQEIFTVYRKLRRA